jgi:hypothetical protein
MNNLEENITTKRSKCTDSELRKSKNILIDSLVSILKTTNNLAFKYSILAKFKLNHLSSVEEIEAVLHKLLDKSIKSNSSEKNKKIKIDYDFDGLNFVENSRNFQENDSIINHSMDNNLNNDDFDQLGNITNSLIKKNDDFDVLTDFKN